MTAFFYYLFIKPASMLPFRVLYIISDILYLVVYHLIGYRKEVVTANLTNSFPGKSEEEIKQIRKQFFHHLCDLIVESLKLFSMPEKESFKRIGLVNGDVPDSFFEQGKDLIVVAGHYSNWEYAVITQPFIKHRIAAAYFPLSNKFFDKKIKSSRSRFGVRLVPTHEIKTYIEGRHDIPTMTLLMADQSPRPESPAYWTWFLNQETGVYTGAERYAKKHNMPVIYAGVRKLRRGYYELYYEHLIDNPMETKEGEITDAYIRRLERQIQKQPEFWLWSHKRWKRKKPDGLIVPGIFYPKKEDTPQEDFSSTN